MLVPTPSLPLALPHGGVGMNTSENIPRRLRSDGNKKDIFALVKGTMSDTVLSQKPLLVWPETLVDKVEDFWNQVNHTTEVIQQTLDESRVEELLKLAAQIERDFPHMTRTVQYYR